MSLRLDLLCKKIQTLSAEQISEVEDFIEFLRARGEARKLSTTVAAVSAPAFATIWNNAEDDAYDVYESQLRLRQDESV